MHGVANVLHIKPIHVLPEGDARRALDMPISTIAVSSVPSAILVESNTPYLIIQYSLTVENI